QSKTGGGWKQIIPVTGQGIPALFQGQDEVTITPQSLNSSTFETGVYTFIVNGTPKCAKTGSAAGTSINITQQKTAAPDLPVIFAALIALVVIGIIARKK
ncbi:MAG TPA: hypothetical protein VJH23_01290, partial [archaeon]|nr:hypothetical protein [archaeon]